MSVGTSSGVGPEATPLTLRLVRHEPDRADPAAMTLAEFFRSYAQRNFLAARQAKPRNVEQYRESMRLWQQYTGDPPLPAIDQEQLTAFSLALQQRTWRGKAIDNRTVNKHLKSVQTVLRLAGPRGERNRLGCGLLAEVPYAALLPESRRRPKPPALLAEVEAAWDVMGEAVEPRVHGIRAGQWGRALWLVLWNTGLRIDAALRAEWRMVEDRWLVVPAGCGKTRHESWIWLNEPALRALQLIRTASPKLFSWPWDPRHWHKFRRTLFAIEGHPERSTWKTHALRRALATYLARHNPAVADLMLGHSGRSILLDHYVDPSIVADLMGRREQPRQAAEWLGRQSGQRQLTLF